MPEALHLDRHDPQPVAVADASIAVRARGRRYDQQKQSLDYVMRSGVAGGLAGCAAKSLIAPLDRVKILFQAHNPHFVKYTGSWAGVLAAMREIRRTDGVRGLFRGHSATLLRVFPYAAIKFMAYEQCRALLIAAPSQETLPRRFASGAVAGVTSVFCVYPLEVIRVRLAFDTTAAAGHSPRGGLRDICTRIWHEPLQLAYPGGGIANFYRGFSPTVLGMLPYAGVSFLMHDLAGDWLRSPALRHFAVKHDDPKRPDKPVLRVWAELASGGFAGLTGQTASYPLEVIRRRMQVGGATGERRFMGIAETAQRIWAEAGVRGFFVGLTIGYVKIVPMFATSFLVYERLKLWFDIG